MDTFPTIEEVNIMLDHIAEGLPAEIFKDLNEGIVLLPSYKLHKKSMPNAPLYIAGEYSVSLTGRNIKIYYGSFKKLYRNHPRKEIYKKLESTLLHEFTHHLESMAGERDLEIEDRIFLRDYEERHK